MQDFKTSRFIYHTKEYLKASVRQAIYSSTDTGMRVVGNLVALLLVLALIPFVMLLLLLAGVAGINVWLELGWGWSLLIGAGVLLLLVLVALLLRKVIVRSVSTCIYRRLHSSLAKIDDKLRPQPMPEDYATESEEPLYPTNDEPTTPTR